MIEFLSQPWPWYVTGPLVGLTVPLLLIAGRKPFGVSSNLQHICAACVPAKPELFRYDWREQGAWNLLFAFGIVVGGGIATYALVDPDPFVIADATRVDLEGLGLRDFTGMLPPELFDWTSARAIGLLVAGGFLVGFGARYSSGCTSGHAITGMANLDICSVITVFGFFAGGLLSAHLLLPWVL